MFLRNSRCSGRNCDPRSYDYAMRPEASFGTIAADCRFRFNQSTETKMAKANKTKSLKLPKRLLGVRVPKANRKRVNRLLKNLPDAPANPLVAAAIGSVMALLLERLEQPLNELVAGPKKTGRTARGPARLQ